MNRFVAITHSHLFLFYFPFCFTFIYCYKLKYIYDFNHSHLLLQHLFYLFVYIFCEIVSENKENNAISLWVSNFLVFLFKQTYYRPTAVQAKRQYLLTSQVSRYCLLHLKSCIVQYLLTLQVGRNCLLPFKSIVNQKILDWSRRTRWMS